MDEITLLCAQKLIDDLMNSSSSSDEDDDFFAVLGYASLLGRSEYLRDDKVNRANSMESNEEQPNLEEVIDALLEDKFEPNLNVNQGSADGNNVANATAAVSAENTDQAEEKHHENNKLNSSDCDLESNAHSSQESVENLSEDKDFSSFQELNNEQGYDESIMDELTDIEFKQSFHLSRETAFYVIEKYSLWYCHSSFQECSQRQRASVKTWVLSFLWFCANAVCLRSAARKFNISMKVARHSFKNVLDFFQQEFASEIKLPSSYIEKEAVAKEFEKIAGFPNVLGCLAESYFTVRKYKLAQKCGGSQIYLRGICDSNRKFLNIKIGFQNETVNDSFIEEDLPKLCFPKYHLLGDSKCPIREHLLIPFDSTDNLSASEKHFNIKLYRTHVKIKNAFGILRSRFRQFKHLDFQNIETLSKFIVTCSILHNICIDRQDNYDDEIYTDVSDRLFRSSLALVKGGDFLTDLGIMKRFELTQILFRAKK